MKTTIKPVLVYDGTIVESNIGEFAKAAREQLAEINLEPSTEEEFGEASLNVKAMGDVEAALKITKEAALAQAEELQAVFSEIDDVSGEIREARLALEKKVAAQKETLKAEVINAALEGIDPKHRRHYRPRIVEATKRKQTPATVQKAVDIEVRKILAELAEAEAVVEQFEKDHEITVFDDDIVRMPVGELRLELKARAEKNARLKVEAERKAAQAELDAKAPAASQAAQAAQGEPRKPVNGNNPQNPEAPTSDVNELAELGAYINTIRAALGGLKAARESLRYPQNQERAAEFGASVNAAWKTLNR